MKKYDKHFVFYTSVALYAVYIFLVNWSAAAQKTGLSWLYELFSSLSIIVLLACCSLIFYRIVRDIGLYAKHKMHVIIFILAFVALAFVAKSISIVLPIILGFIAVGSNNKKTAKVIVASLSALLLLSFVWYILGLRGGDTISKPLFGDDSFYSVTVPALGMSNPNGIMLIFITIIALSLYLCNTKRQLRYATGVLLILTLVLSILTGSTTGMAIGIATIVLMNYFKISRRHSKVQRAILRIAPWALVIATLLTFAIATTFGPGASLPNPVNDTLTTRPFMWNLRIENNSFINLYGNNDQYISDASAAGNDSAYALDNMTLFMLVQYGIIAYLIFFFIFFKGTKKLNDPTLVVYILIVCSLMLVERMYLYSFVFIFLQKAITESYLEPMNNNKEKGRLHA